MHSINLQHNHRHEMRHGSYVTWTHMNRNISKTAAANRPKIKSFRNFRNQKPVHSSKSNLVLRGPRAPFSEVLCSCSIITFLYSGAFEKGNALNHWTICLSWVDCTIDLCRRLHLIQRSLRLWEESLSCGGICSRQFLTHLILNQKVKTETHRNRKHATWQNWNLNKNQFQISNFKFQTFKFQTTNKSYPSKSLQVQRVTVHLTATK